MYVKYILPLIIVLLIRYSDIKSVLCKFIPPGITIETRLLFLSTIIIIFVNSLSEYSNGKLNNIKKLTHTVVFPKIIRFSLCGNMFDN